MLNQVVTDKICLHLSGINCKKRIKIDNQIKMFTFKEIKKLLTHAR